MLRARNWFSFCFVRHDFLWRKSASGLGVWRLLQSPSRTSTQSILNPFLQTPLNINFLIHKPVQYYTHTPLHSTNSSRSHTQWTETKAQKPWSRAPTPPWKTTAWRAESTRLPSKPYFPQLPLPPHPFSPHPPSPFPPFPLSSHHSAPSTPLPLTPPTNTTPARRRRQNNRHRHLHILKRRRRRLDV